MKDAISTGRLALCHPLLIQKMETVDSVLVPQGIVVRITGWNRSFADQAKEWAKGRKGDVVIDPDAVVTHARPGYSPHNFGYAVDCVPGVRGAAMWTPNWNVIHPDFILMVKACEAEGLIAGIRWAKPKTDPDHFQLSEFPVTPTDGMRAALTQGLAHVWNTFAPQNA